MNKLLHSNYIGSSQDKQPFFSTFLHFPKNFPPARGRCPLDSRTYAAGGPMRTAPEGSALWTPAPTRRAVLCGQHQRALPSGLPLGLMPQTPRCCASLLRLRAGRGIWCGVNVCAAWASPPKGLRAGRDRARIGIGFGPQKRPRPEPVTPALILCAWNKPDAALPHPVCKVGLSGLFIFYFLRLTSQRNCRTGRNNIRCRRPCRKKIHCYPPGRFLPLLDLRPPNRVHRSIPPRYRVICR